MSNELNDPYYDPLAGMRSPGRYEVPPLVTVAEISAGASSNGLPRSYRVEDVVDIVDEFAPIGSGSGDLSAIETAIDELLINFNSLSGLSNALNGKAPLSHTHGNITSSGTIGNTSGLPIKTGASGILETGVFGISAGQFAEGNDARFSGIVSATTLVYSSTLTPNCNDGLHRKVTMTGNLTINAPTNAQDGMIWRGRFLASGAAWQLTFNAAIKTPTGVTYEPTVASGSSRVIHLEYDGTRWVMVRNLEFIA